MTEANKRKLSQAYTLLQEIMETMTKEEIYETQKEIHSAMVKACRQFQMYGGIKSYEPNLDTEIKNLYINEFGRVNVPKSLRDVLNIHNDARLNVWVKGDTLCMQKEK